MAELDARQYESTVQNLIKQIDEKRLSNPAEAIPVCVELEEYALANNIGELYGYAQYWRALCLYLLNHLEQSFSYFSNAVLTLEETGQWGLASRAYNTMGILSAGQGNIPNAMDYYMKGETVCREHDQLPVSVFIHSNVAMLYLKYHNVDNCRRHLFIALDGVNSLRKEDGSFESLSYAQAATIYLNMASCYCQEGNYEKATESLTEASKLYSKAEDEQLEICGKMLWVQIYDLAGDIVKRDEYIQELVESVLPSEIIMDIFDDIMSYAWFLLKIDKEAEFWNTVNGLERLTKTTDSANLNRYIAELKISYYKKKERHSEYLMETGLYYELSMKMEEEKERINSESMATRVRLEEEQRTRKAIENEAIDYKIRAEIDALTGLNNRYMITNISEKNFEYCLEQGMPLAVEILDIDHFKQYNDNYGHLEGDHILSKVSAVLRSLERHTGIYAGRYGGDEFLVIYVNRTYDEVIEFMQELKNRIEELKLPHEYSPVHNLVSISQGAYYRIPSENMTPLDFLHQADHALYHVKKHGKNNFCITKE